MRLAMAEVMYLRFHSGEVEGEEAIIEAVNQKGNIPRRATVAELAYAQIPECFHCPLCKEILKDATSAVPCTCVYCRHCITEHIQQENPVCLVCPTPLEKTHMRQSLSMQRGINAIQIRCEYGVSYSLKERRFTARGSKFDGCMAVVSYSDYDRHIQVCEKALLPCGYQRDGCPTVTTRQALASHEAECEYQKYICECGESMSLAIMDQHMVDCNARRMPCKHESYGCDVRVKAMEMEEHLETCDFEAHVRVAQIAIVDCLSAAKRKLVRYQQTDGQTDMPVSRLKKIEEELISMMRSRTQTVKVEVSLNAMAEFKVELDRLGFFSSSPNSSHSTSPGRSSPENRLSFHLGSREGGEVSRRVGEATLSLAMESIYAQSSTILEGSARSWSSPDEEAQSPLSREGSDRQYLSGSDQLRKASCRTPESHGYIFVRNGSSLASSRSGSDFRLYTMGQIMDATKNFSEQNCIGRGAFGAVYKGMLQGTQVAVKRLLRRDDKRFQLETEVNVLQKLRHPNVVLLIGCSPEAQCIVSEYLSGGSLQDRLKGDRSTLRWIHRIRICLEMAAALLYMHLSRILHRDLKPANVLLSQDGTCKLCDMGLATLLDLTSRQSDVKGTIGYMDPHWVSTRDLSAATDVYGLGLIILQLVTGQSEIPVIHQLLERCGERRNSDMSVGIFLNHLDYLAGPWQSDSVRDLLRIALRCVERSKQARPDLETVVQPELERIYMAVTQDEGKGAPVNPEQKKAEEFAKMACAGMAEAQNELGNCYKCGYGVVKSPWEAVSWYKKAANQEYVQAEYNLGICYEQGEGIEQNFEAAAKWYEKAAHQGHPGAQSKLGDCYKNGQGVLPDLSIAMKWYKKAANAGDPGAQFNLGLAYFTGEGLAEDLELAVFWYKKAAEQGHLGAHNNLGYCYKVGKGVQKNLEEATKWYQSAAERGHAASQNNLGNCYFNAEGVPQDYEMAKRWYSEAAQKGYASAQQNLGICYNIGKGVPQDHFAAAFWFKRAAEQQNAASQLELGRCYKHGLGVEKCHKTAVQWFRKAAEQEHAAAQNELAVCYSQGLGVEESPSEAVQWWRRAAKQGNADAQYSLADCLIMAKGTKGNRTEARALLQSAMEKGHSSAKAKLGSLSLLYSFNARQGRR